MKTIKKYMIILIISLFSSTMLTSQVSIIGKEVEIRVDINGKHHETIEKLRTAVELGQGQILSLKEFQTKNGNKNTITTFRCDQQVFEKVDKICSDAGYVSFREIKSDYEGSKELLILKNRLAFLKNKKARINKELETMSKEHEKYYQYWEELNYLEEEIFKCETELLKKEQEALNPYNVKLILY